MPVSLSFSFLAPSPAAPHTGAVFLCARSKTPSVIIVIVINRRRVLSDKATLADPCPPPACPLSLSAATWVVFLKPRGHNLPGGVEGSVKEVNGVYAPLLLVLYGCWQRLSFLCCWWCCTVLCGGVVCCGVRLRTSAQNKGLCGVVKTNKRVVVVVVVVQKGAALCVLCVVWPTHCVLSLSCGAVCAAALACVLREIGRAHV